MEDDTTIRVLAAIYLVEALLGQAHGAALEFEMLAAPHRALDRLSDHIQSVRAAAENMRAQLQGMSDGIAAHPAFRAGLLEGVSG